MSPKSTRQPKAFLALEDATFRLGDRLVFERTNWRFEQHEQWAIIGANGSGKSVLADGLRGRLPLVHGELRYGFQPPRGLSQEEAIGHVAFEARKTELHGTVVQSRWTSFEEEASLKVADFLSYERVMDINPFEIDPNRAVARRAFEARLRRAVRLFQVSGFLGRTLLSLSNGERQRVQLARALAQPLRLLILDEPYIGLDRITREYFHGVLERLLETNLRVLLITTRVEDLPQHVTHLLWVDGCRIVGSGPHAAVLSRRNKAPGVRVWGGRSSSKNARTRESGGESAAGGCSLHAFFCGARDVPARSAAEATHGLKTSEPHRAVNPLRAGTARAPGDENACKEQAAAKLFELRNVTVRYGETVILDQVNWTLHEGESWALLGPNGSGKTTLLSLIQGDHPQAYVNEVIVFGRQRGSGESVWELKKRIGWVSPELQLHFDDTVSVLDAVLSGFDQTIGLFQMPGRRQATAARHWLKHFGLIEWAELPLFSLSAGLQRMTLLARALVKEPPLLILDEPCQGLDPAHRKLIIKSVDQLIRSRAVTAIFVTHRPEEIPGSIRRVMRLGLPNPKVG